MMANLLSRKQRNRVIYLFFLAIVGPLIEDFLKELTTLEFLSACFGVIDELFVLFLLLFSAIHGLLKFEKFEIYLSLFVSCGLISGVIADVPWNVLLLGAYSTIKSMLLFSCFRSFNFDIVDIKKFLRLVCSLFSLLFVLDICDLVNPNFRQMVGYERLPEIRMGIRSVSGLMRETHLTMLMVLMYFSFKYYLSKGNLYQYASIAMIVLTLKIKDIVGFFIPFFVLKYRRLNPFSIIVTGLVFYGMFSIYSILMPDHYARYFGDDDLTERQARPVLYITSTIIAKDYAPFGVGFGRYGSPTSQQIESPVYSQYGIDGVYGLDYIHNSRFMSDTFWPMILGETGILGLVVYLLCLYCAFSKYIKYFLQKTDNKNVLLPTVIFVFCFISSFAKPTLSGPPNSFIVWGLAGMFYYTNHRNCVNDKKC